MSTLQDIRKNVIYPTPFYAWVGLVDKAVDQVRVATDEASKKVGELREQLSAESIVGRTQEVATERVERVQQLPKRVEESSKAAFAQAEQSYAGLSKRGAAVIAELRKQQDAQAQQVINQGKASAASARKVAEDAQALAAKAVLTGRKEAAKQVEAVAGTVETAADKLGDEARTEVRSTAARVGSVDKATPKAKPAAKKPAVKKPAAKKAPAKRPAAKPAAKKTAPKTAAAKSSAPKTTAPKTTEVKSTAPKATEAKTTEAKTTSPKA
ncbi:hypothetical protein [Demetria terragena]|uniref:hypothetical protein n=1 Tax=Demetria terragena TaxID=63959 RepID=UPI0012EAA18F|nr:hypothetical protein [Demetria terragena]